MKAVKGRVVSPVPYSGYPKRSQGKPSPNRPCAFRYALGYPVVIAKSRVPNPFKAISIDWNLIQQKDGCVLNPSFSLAAERSLKEACHQLPP